MYMRKIIVLDKITNKEELFINNVKIRLKGTLVHKLSNTDKIKDLMDLLGWDNKLKQEKYSTLTKELYSIWEEYDAESTSRLYNYIDNQFGDNHVFFLYATNGDRLEKLRERYPKQVMSFDLQVNEDDSNLDDEIKRLLDEIK